jgi:hypothetical protein
MLIVTCNCGEFHPSAILRNKGICANCNARNRGWPRIRQCERCNQLAPCDKHHKNGPFTKDKAPLRVLDETIVVCINCHRITHALKRVNRI